MEYMLSDTIANTEEADIFSRGDTKQF